jgi:hypothetical protein
MYIASKIEEVSIPRTSDFALATDGGYTKEQIIEMELNLMQLLSWKLYPVTIVNWSNWYI